MIPIIIDDNDVLIVNKPSGIDVHDSVVNGQQIKGIVSILRQQTGYRSLHLCHRLDLGTSGCLCLAKNSQTAAIIGDAFASRHVTKYYLAISKHKPKKKQGTIIGDMKNRRGGQYILMKTSANPAITQFFSQSAKPGFRGFIVKPLTGKTHQIRVALKSLGAPILGDTLYGGAPSDRLHLHAWKLNIPLPNRTLSLTAPMLNGHMFNDSDITQWLDNLPSPDSFEWPEVSPFLLSKVSIT